MTDSWVRAGEIARWVKGRGRRVDVAGTAVAVFWDGTRFIAVADACPHMGASLADGHLVGSDLQCSWHEWRYDTTTGQCSLRAWAKVRVYETRVEGGALWIKAPDPEPPPPEEDEPEWLTWDPTRYFKK